MERKNCLLSNRGVIKLELINTPKECETINTIIEGLPDDLLICAGSPEIRCLGIAKRLAQNYKAKNILLIRYSGHQSEERERNIRELKNMLERALILSHGETPEVHHFPGLSDETIVSSNPENPEDLESREQRQVLAVLARFKGNTTKASKVLGISRASLYRKMDNYKKQEQIRGEDSGK